MIDALCIRMYDRQIHTGIPDTDAGWAWERGGKTSTMELPDTPIVKWCGTVMDKDYTTVLVKRPS